MMENEILTQHLQRIIDEIADLEAVTANVSYEDFVQDETAKEQVYEQMQEIGEIAREILDQEELPEDLPLGALKNLRNARFNQEAEINHQAVYYLVKEDFPEIVDEIKASELYQSHV